MPFTDLIGDAASAAAVVAPVVTVSVLLREQLRHRWHLGQIEQDHRRLFRLSNRLAGCITELDELLGSGIHAPIRGEMPEEVAGHLRYLYGLRVEHESFVIRAQAHAARGGVARLVANGSPAAGHCNAAHDALAKASAALHVACALYEVGFVDALRRDPRHRAQTTLSEPVRPVPADRLDEMLRLRAEFEEHMRTAAMHFVRPVLRLEWYRCTWPVLRSELAEAGDDPYCGEVRPLSWAGFGPVAALHPAAR